MADGKIKNVDNLLNVPPRHRLMVVRQQVICQLVEKGYRTTEIAIITGIDKSSISRALKYCGSKLSNNNH